MRLKGAPEYPDTMNVDLKHFPSQSKIKLCKSLHKCTTAQ